MNEIQPSLRDYEPLSMSPVDNFRLKIFYQPCFWFYFRIDFSAFYVGENQLDLKC